MREIEKINHTGEVPVMEPQRQFYFMDLAKQYVTQISRKKGRPLTFHVTTFGCQMNARDSEKLCGILETVGFEETDSEEADFVIYNTCTVRENANNKVYGRLGYLSGFKKKNKDMMIALCGCMMQEPEVVEKLKQSYRFVDLVFGTHNIFKFAELLVRCFEEQKMVIDIWDDTKEIVEELPVERKYSFKSGVNIMFGCNNFCSYCIVPYVRGRERSRKPQDIIREIEKLVADGVVEVMLLGQNVNSYGKNLDTPVTFAQLLQEVEKIEGLERIRFMTSHPKDLSDELIEVMKNSKKICRHLHLPLQSGSSRVLKEMNRHYDKEHYLALVEKIKKAMPDLAITTDIIVGFPGETEEDFLETMDVVRQVEYDSAFTFIYSKRTGTPAAKMENQIPEDVIKDRFDRLLKLVQDISAKKAGALTGSVQDVLVEEMNRHYDKEHYLALVEKIKKAMPDLAITTDIIVGFPGETEEDFLETMDVVRQVEYDSAFTFIYSKRTGTPAAKMENQIPEDVIKDRFDRLLKLVQDISAKKAGALTGSVQDVLVEELDEQQEGLVTGRLSNNSVVHLPGDVSMIGTIVPVLLKECKGFYYMGEVAE